MFERETLSKLTKEYKQIVASKRVAPTYKGLSLFLGVSDTTIGHIVRGYYKDDKQYTNMPHCNRCVDNADFDLIRDIYF